MTSMAKASSARWSLRTAARAEAARRFPLRRNRRIVRHAHAGTRGAMLPHPTTSPAMMMPGHREGRRKAPAAPAARRAAWPVTLPAGRDDRGGDAGGVEAKFLEEPVRRTLGHEGVRNAKARDRTGNAHPGELLEHPRSEAPR